MTRSSLPPHATHTHAFGAFGSGSSKFGTPPPEAPSHEAVSPFPHPQIASAASHLLSVGVTILLFGVIASTARLWQFNGPRFIPSGSYTLIPAIICTLLALWSARRTITQLTITPLGGAVGLLLVFISDWLDRSYNFFPNPSVRGEILLGGGLLLLLGNVLIARVGKWLPWVSALILALVFLAEGQGRLLFSDDHPSFLFRLSLLREQFPQIPFYYPFWNAGLDARDFFATGALGVFLLFSPVLYSLDSSSLSSGTVYNLLVAALLFVVVPTCMYLAAATQRLPPLTRALSALLALCLGLVWYRWALKYGTMGFVLSTALIPLNFTLTLSLLDIRDSHSWPKAWLRAGALLIGTTLMLFWSPSGLVFVPMALGIAVLSIYRLVKRIPLPTELIATTIAVLVLNAPWIALFWSVSDVGRFLNTTTAAVRASESSIGTPEVLDGAVLGAGQIEPTGQQPAALEPSAHRGTRHRKGEIDLGKSLSLLREKSFSTNPLILFFALPGILLLRPQSRWFMLSTSAWLLFLGSVMVPVKPQLELDRMLLILSMLLCLPCGLAIASILERRPENPAWARLLVGGFLFASPLCSAAVLSNRTVDQYHFAGPFLDSLANAIRTHGGNGRVVFSGCIVHEVEEGHIAPLTLMTGKEIVASAPFHTLWRYTQVVPKSFMERGNAGIEDYFDMMNASAVIAHEREWRDYFSQRPERYQLAWREDRFSLYTRQSSTYSPFLSGAGAITARETAGLRLNLSTPDATIKYRYFPFLQVDAPDKEHRSQTCRILPAEVAPEITFIELRNCPVNTELHIHAGSPWKRVF